MSTPDPTGRRWPAIAAAQARDPLARLPFCIDDAGRALPVGSVARAHLGALARWPAALRRSDDALTLVLPAAERTAFFDQANRALHAAGLIVGWRDETYGVLALGSGALLATFERAASRFWGSTTFGAHCNGYVAGADGRPHWLWIARRSYHKPTDPGLLDNLIGGGVPHGQSPAETVVREGWEEAGLRPQQMAGLQPGRRLQVARDIPEGFQLEEVSAFDLALPAGLTPRNQDGEVHSLTLMPVAQALACAAAGQMTVDAALVTLDFALRHGLLDADEHQRLARASAALWRGPSQLDR
jgi:8-oxo-dGTP pyrophosphatase MutT (NUDIX family)